MSIKIMSDVWSKSKATGAKLLVLLALADFANEENGYCWASYDTIASKARITRRHAIRAINELEIQGELRIIKCGEKNSNEYLVFPGGSDKLSLPQMKMVTRSHPPSDTMSPPVVTLCHPNSDTRSPDPLINRQLKQDHVVKQLPPERPNIFSLYEKYIGPLFQGIQLPLEELEDKYHADWIKDAFKIAAENNRRKLSYVRGVLQNWEANGRDWTPRKNGKKPAKTKKNTNPFLELEV